ncbi:hypothetical protein BKA61DRAFT_466819, partial [Leptodontidium sp. MPI-SDFR-AT-0119]
RTFPLLSRTWVYQERSLSPRTLHFHSTEMIMEYSSHLRCECIRLDTFPLKPVDLKTASDMHALR